MYTHTHVHVYEYMHMNICVHVHIHVHVQVPYFRLSLIVSVLMTGLLICAAHIQDLREQNKQQMNDNEIKL